MRKYWHRVTHNPCTHKIVAEGAFVTHLVRFGVLIVTVHSVSGALTVAGIAFLVLAHICTIEDVAEKAEAVETSVDYGEHEEH